MSARYDAVASRAVEQLERERGEPVCQDCMGSGRVPWWHDDCDPCEKCSDSSDRRIEARELLRRLLAESWQRTIADRAEYLVGTGTKTT